MGFEYIDFCIRLYLFLEGIFYGEFFKSHREYNLFSRYGWRKKRETRRMKLRISEYKLKKKQKAREVFPWNKDMGS